MRPRFAVGDRVVLTRDLPTQKAGADGTVRGLSPTPQGPTYAVKFSEGMRIVRESDLQDVPGSPSR